jgi:hypothetical protein
MDQIEAPRLEHVADFDVDIAPVIEVGQTGSGERRVIPIVGGRVTGPRLNGKILPSGADFQIIRPNGIAELTARYAIEADDGALIYVENTGIRHGPPELVAKLRRGEPVDPRLIYFRTLPRFETASPQYAFLMRHVFVASGARHKDRVRLGVFLVA